MATTFVIADLHFQHAGAIKWLKDDGTRYRPFDTIEEMDETIVQNWNKVVTPDDKVYVLGDVSMNKHGLTVVGRLNGTKVLIKGNHDNCKPHDYLSYFKDIRGSWQLGEYILTHIPIHQQSLARWAKGSIHGHLHSNRVLLENGEIDRRYICVSVEQTNYTPWPFDDIEKLKDSKIDGTLLRK